MSQAEIAGGSVTPRGELPSKGRRLQDFQLTSTAHRLVRLSDYRGRSNLVVVVGDDQQASKQLLIELNSRYAEIRSEQAEILVIVQTPEQARELREQCDLQCPVLADEDGGVHRMYGAVDAQGNASAAVYVTDRFAEVFGVYRTCDGQSLPTVAEVLDWLEFINSQCPECEPPEWPA